MKLWAEAEVIDDDAALLAWLDNPAYPARLAKAAPLQSIHFGNGMIVRGLSSEQGCSKGVAPGYT